MMPRRKYKYCSQLPPPIIFIWTKIQIIRPKPKNKPANPAILCILKHYAAAITFPTPFTRNRIIQGIRKFRNSEFCSMSIGICKYRPSGLMTSNAPLIAAPMPTNDCKTPSAKYAVRLMFTSLYLSDFTWLFMTSKNCKFSANLIAFIEIPT